MSSVVWDAERRLAQRPESYWPLPFIDDMNGVRVGGEKELDEALGAAAEAAGIRWDRTKDWKGTKGKHLGVTMQDQRRHQKYRSQKAVAAWEIVKRLCKLPAKGKRTLVTQQLLPIFFF